MTALPNATHADPRNALRLPLDDTAPPIRRLRRVSPLLLIPLLIPLTAGCGAMPTAGPPSTLDEPAAARSAPSPPIAERKTRTPVARRKTKAARPASPAAPAPLMVAAAPTPLDPVVSPPSPAPDPAPPLAGGHHLARLHPEVRRMARALFAEAAAEGIELKFISGYRAFDRKSAKAKAGKASWHAFGMAFDINLAHRINMKDALAHYRAEKAQWDRVGAIAERLGLIWGLHWGRDEVFHFEWHPGMPQAIRRPTLTALLRDAGADGKAIERVWRRFPMPEAGGGPQDERAIARREDR